MRVFLCEQEVDVYGCMQDCGDNVYMLCMLIWIIYKQVWCVFFFRFLLLLYLCVLIYVRLCVCCIILCVCLWSEKQVESPATKRGWSNKPVAASSPAQVSPAGPASTIRGLERKYVTAITHTQNPSSSLGINRNRMCIITPGYYYGKFAK